MSSLRNRRAFTLIEIMIYATISLMVLSTILGVYLASLRLFRTASSSYLMSNEALSAYRTLQQDLRETSLSSIVVADQGFAFVSARDPEKPAEFRVSRFGVPQWTSAVYYRLEPQDGRYHHLVRYASKLDRPKAIPAPPAFVSGPISTSHRRVVMRYLLPPGKGVQAGSDGYRLVDRAKEKGGARLGFLVRDEQGQLSDTPTHPSANDGRVTTGMVRLDLKLIDPGSQSGKLNYLEYSLVVTPRH